MTHLLKRGEIFWYDRVWKNGRLRFSLHTRYLKAAQRLCNRIEFALADGPRSAVWGELRPVLSDKAFEILTKGLDIPPQSDLSDFQIRFEDRLERRVKLGELADRSRTLYAKTADVFFKWLTENFVQIMDEITPEIVERYLVERRTSIIKRGGTGNGLVTDYTTLSSLFNFAIEDGVLQTSPLKGKYQPDSDAPPVKPFTKEELAKLETNLTDEDRLSYFLLRWTGLRGSDACEVTWDSINWTDRSLTWQTRKRGKWVTIPLHDSLRHELSALVPEHYVDLTQPILGGITRAKLYRLIAALGKRAGVKDVHPHRFRAHLVCELLSKGATLFDVSKIIGDTHSVVEKFYAANTDGLQDRVRGILESAGQNPGTVVY